MTERHQVIIVGGGPVGMALAVELGQRNVDCVVIERHLEVGRIPKGQNLTQRTLEHFYFWHCVDELRAARLLPPGYPIGGLTAYGNLASEYWYAPPGLEQVRSFYFQENERLPQYLTEEVLRVRAAKLPSVTTMLGWTANRVEQDEAGVRVSVTSGEWPYEEQLLEADYVVGCDGSRSVVRAELGIERVGPDYDQRMLLAVFKSTKLHEGLERFPNRTTFRVIKPETRGIWQFFGRVDVGTTWFFHGPVPKSTTADDVEYLHALLEEVAGFPLDVEFDYIGFWDMRIEVATTYRHGRGFIAGDACHSHPPYGGFGLNTGIEDVANLGWKLAAVLDGWGGDELLDSYSSERQPVFEETGLKVIANGIAADDEFMQTYNPTVDKAAFEAAWKSRTSGDAAGPSYEPNYEGSSVVFGAEGASIGASGSHAFAARAGHHLAPLGLSSGRNVYEDLGTGFTLLAFDAPPSSVAALETGAREVGVPLTVISDDLGGDRAEFAARLVVVRPDQFVAWTGDDSPAEVSSIFARAAGQD